MTNFEDPTEIKAWLADKPKAWSAAVALRVALRIIPTVSNPKLYSNSAALFPACTATFRCGAASWIAVTYPTLNKPKIRAAARAAARATFIAHTTSPPSMAEGYVGRAVADAVHAAAYAARAAAYVRAALYTSNATYAAIDAAVDADDAHTADGTHDADMFLAISRDCDLLGKLELDPVRAKLLLQSPLWPDAQPEWFINSWAIAKDTLFNTDQSFEIWRDWFQRRIDGEAIGFALLPEADSEISRRLVGAKNEWWERDSALVNADIKAWLTELTSRINEPNEADFAQNPRAITFGADADGRIGLTLDLTSNRLLDDADAQDRHAEVVREAKALQAASQHGQTQATDLDQPTLDFLEAVGENLAETKPSWLVARGEKLRRMRGQRQNGTSLAPPLSERQAEAIDALITALDIMVGLDPYLLSIRQASYDPDMPRGAGDPVAIRMVIEHALEIKVARADAHDALLDGVENVPANAAPDDRRRLTLWADFKNFIQATGRFIWKHKGKVTTGVVAAITLIQLNAAMLKGIFVASPTMLEIIRWIEMIKLSS